MVPFTLSYANKVKIQLMVLASHLVIGFTMPQPVKAQKSEAKRERQAPEFQKAYDRHRAIKAAHAYIESLNYFADYAESRGFQTTAKAADELARHVGQRISAYLGRITSPDTQRKRAQLHMQLYIEPAAQKAKAGMECELGADHVLTVEFRYTQRFKGNLIDALKGVAG